MRTIKSCKSAQSVENWPKASEKEKSLIIHLFDHCYNKCDLLRQIEQHFLDNKTTHVFLLYFIGVLRLRTFPPFSPSLIYVLFQLYAVYFCSFHSNHTEQMKCDTGINFFFFFYSVLCI